MDYKDFDLGDLLISSSGMDSFLGGDAEALDVRDIIASKNPPTRMRVASVGQLTGFTRVASDTLIRKSERDLWSLNQTDNGEWVIERLFDEDGNPLKV